MSDKLDLIRDKLAKARGRKILLSGADYDILDALDMIVNVLDDLEDWAWNYRPLYRRNHDGHWVCDKGYEPDGLDVTGPNGVFTPQPARCKAKEKP